MSGFRERLRKAYQDDDSFSLDETSLAYEAGARFALEHVRDECRVEARAPDSTTTSSHHASLWADVCDDLLADLQSQHEEKKTK